VGAKVINYIGFGVLIAGTVTLLGITAIHFPIVGIPLIAGISPDAD
jgi:hypothetical protein